MAEQSLSRKQLKAQTGASGYIIDYLNDCNRLPVELKSKGRGYPTLYHPDAVQVVKEHLLKGDINCSHTT
jgi:hypothetical protein